MIQRTGKTHPVSSQVGIEHTLFIFLVNTKQYNSTNWYKKTIINKRVFQKFIYNMVRIEFIKTLKEFMYIRTIVVIKWEIGTLKLM